MCRNYSVVINRKNAEGLKRFLRELKLVFEPSSCGADVFIEICDINDEQVKLINNKVDELNKKKLSDIEISVDSEFSKLVEMYLDMLLVEYKEVYNDNINAVFAIYNAEKYQTVLIKQFELATKKAHNNITELAKNEVRQLYNLR